MKLVRYLGVSAMVAGLAAFSLANRAEAPEVDLTMLSPHPPELNLEMVRELPFAPVPAPPATPSDQEPDDDRDERADDDRRDRDDDDRDRVDRDDDDDRWDRDRRRRRGRSRSRNRYPGPIPTPAEWEPPAGPVRIALQAGHWRAHEAPPELESLKSNGTTGGGKAEWEVNLAIAQSAARMLEAKGYVVDILPAVVPPGYRAHLFISIHADGALDPAATGYRVASPRRDATGRADRMVSLLEESYGRATGIKRLPTITRRMSSYYAFNFRRYEHALHPMTIGVIIETGFLTSPSDRRIIVNDPDRVARGIVEAVAAFPETPPPNPDGAIGGS